LVEPAYGEQIAQQFPQLAEQVGAYPVLPGEDPWTYDDVSAIIVELLTDRDRMVEELREAQEDLDELLHGAGDGAGDDQADFGSNTLERDQQMALVNNLKYLLAQTDNALDRIKAGEYATCEGTGGPIGKARLQAFPRATLSVAAKAAQERHAG
jgi:DnaK suppressor protein